MNNKVFSEFVDEVAKEYGLDDSYKSDMKWINDGTHILVKKVSKEEFEKMYPKGESDENI